MKTVVALLLFAAPAFAATWDQLPLVSFLHDVDIRSVENDFAVLHPWKATDPLPTSFGAAGLTQPVRLVACDIYLDGGSRYYLFRGANSRYLVVCTDPGSFGAPDSKKVIPVDKPRLFLGASHFSDKNKVLIPYDSECERFLLAAIKNEVDRINRLPTGRKDVPNQLPEPTSPSVTPPAGAGGAPSVAVAH
jgi:hypothetical protein